MPECELVRVENVSKAFTRGLKRSLWYGVCDIAHELVGRSVRHDALRSGEFWAVEDVSFALRRGESLGLIGRNGAGKSTLLKMLNGLFKPDRGRITMRGRVGALIELGTGFNPILSGRENIYNNAAVLGIPRREVDKRLEQIIDFAELDGEAIDAPVQTYSSGMRVRLGFAVAAHMSPDILLIDEVLAVGDIGFVIKCLNAVRALANRAAVVFVSHNMQLVSYFCTRIVVMGHGAVLTDTREVGAGIGVYLDQFPVTYNVAGTGQAAVQQIAFSGHATPAGVATTLRQSESVALELDLCLEQATAGANVTLYIMDEAMTPVVCHPLTNAVGSPLILNAGTHRLVLPLGRLDLNAGKYSVTLGIQDQATHLSLARVQGLLPFRVAAEKVHWGNIVRPICPLQRNSRPA